MINSNIMISWDAFLQIVADEQDVINFEERQTFLTFFAEENLTNQVSATQIATKLAINLPTLQIRLGKAYTAVANRYSELVTVKNNKIKILYGLLKKEYSNYQNNTWDFSNINWQQICQISLDNYAENFLKKNSFNNFYIPVGVFSPKQQEKTIQEYEDELSDDLSISEELKIFDLFVQERSYIKTYTKINDFFDKVLQKGQSKSKGQKLAIIGEHGSGKTTLLYKIARGILHKKLGYPILIRLAEVDQPIKEFLIQNWLFNATKILTENPPEFLSEFTQIMQEGKVWLLLDGIDEMGIKSPLANIKKQLEEVSLQGLKVILTCRLNVWNEEANVLNNFDIYHNLNLNKQQVKIFIKQWFNDIKQAKKLINQLNNVNKTFLRKIIKNPQKLGLLCKTWEREQQLPETQADFYKMVVNNYYKWQQEKRSIKISEELQKTLHYQLGELAKRVLNNDNFSTNLEETLIQEYLGNPQQENSVFYWALQLRWLNPVGVTSPEKKNAGKAVYSFLDPNFYEYFAALTIQDWDYFLPRNHVNYLLEGKEYRIFNPHWKQVILLWLGRDDIEDMEKEKFIQKLVTFNEGCNNWNYDNINKSFYEYYAYFLAAVGINEFKKCSLADEIVEQVVKYCFGYFNSEKQKWVRFFRPIENWAQKILSETIKQKVINNLIRILSIEQIQNQDIYRKVNNILSKFAITNHLAIQEIILILKTPDINKKKHYKLLLNTLGIIAVGNKLAIQTLTQLLKNNDNNNYCIILAEILATIDPGNQVAIQTVLRILKTPDNKLILERAINSRLIKKIAYKNELVIKTLENMLESNDDNDDNHKFQTFTQLLKNNDNNNYCIILAEILATIDPGNQVAIQTVLRILKTPDNKLILERARNSCLIKKIAYKNELVIKTLENMLESNDDNDDNHKFWIAYNLMTIEPNNEVLHRWVIRFIETNNNHHHHLYNSRTIGVIDILVEIASIIGNELATEILIRRLEAFENKSFNCKFAQGLEKIAVGNELAIQKLIGILESLDNAFTYWSYADTIEKIALGHELLVIQEFIRILETTENEDTHWRVVSVLTRLAVGNEFAIKELVRILEKTEEEMKRWLIVDLLGKISGQNELVITELIQLVETSNNKNIIIRSVSSLEQFTIDNNQLVIQALIKALEKTYNENNSMNINDFILEIESENELANDFAFEFMQASEMTDYEEIRCSFADCLGRIAVGNELAISSLIQFITNTKAEYTRRNFIKNLGKIGINNELAIQALTQLLQTNNDEYTCRIIAENLAKINRPLAKLKYFC